MKPASDAGGAHEARAGDELEAWAARFELFLGAAEGAASVLAELATPPAGGEPSRRAALIGKFWRRLELAVGAVDEPGWLHCESLARGRSARVAENLASTYHGVLLAALTDALARGNDLQRPWLATANLPVAVVYNSELDLMPADRRCALAQYSSVPEGHPLRKMIRADECRLYAGQPCLVLGPIAGRNTSILPQIAPFYDCIGVANLTRAVRAPQALAEGEAQRREEGRRLFIERQTTPEQRRIAALEEQLARLHAGKGAQG